MAIGSKQLQLARRWASQLGNNVEDVPGVDAEGKPVAGVGIRHGQVLLIVVEPPTGVLMVMAILEVPPDLRKAIGALPAQLQSKMYDTLKLALMDCPRAGFAFLPQTATSLGLVERVQLMELLRIEESNIESFNHFSDTIQELVTLMVRTQQLFSTIFVGGPSMDSRSQASKESGMFR